MKQAQTRVYGRIDKGWCDWNRHMSVREDLVAVSGGPRGGEWVGEVDMNTLQVSMHVDWVKFYEGSKGGVKFSEFIKPAAKKPQKKGTVNAS